MTVLRQAPAVALMDNITGALVGLMGADGKEYVLPASAYDNDNAYLYAAPATGFNQTIKGTVSRVLLDPAGTLATGTLTLQAGQRDGWILEIASNQTITALTVTGSGCSLGNGMPTTLAATSGIAFVYRTANNKWYRLR